MQEFALNARREGMMRHIIGASIGNVADTDLLSSRAGLRQPRQARLHGLRQKRLSRFFRAALATVSARALMVATAAIPIPAMAADKIWQGTGGGSDWTVGTNWSPNGQPGAADDVKIKGVLANDAIIGVTTGVTTTINSLAMAADGQNSGQAKLTIQNGSVLTINVSTAVGANTNSTTQLFVQGASTLISKGDASLGGTVGGGTVTVDGTGSNWQVQGANGLFVGNNGGIGKLQVNNGGEVNVTRDLWLGNTASSSGTMNITSGKVQVGRDIQFGNGGTATATVGGGTGSATLEATNVTYLGNTSSGKMTVDSNGHVTSNNNFHIGYQTGGQGELIIQNGGVVTAKSVTSLIRNGGTSAKLTVTGAGSTLETRELQRWGTTGTAQATFNGGTLRALGASTSFIAGFTGTEFSIGANGMIIDSNGFAVTAAAPLTSSANGALTVNDSSTTQAGNLTLSGANTFVGLTVNGGTVTAGSATAFGQSSGVLTVNGGTAALNNNSMTFAGLRNTSGTGGTVSLGSATLTLNQATDTSYAGAITGTGGLTKNGTGKLTLTGSATSFSGQLNVNAGAIAINGGSVSAGETRVGSNANGANGTLTITNGSLTTNGRATVGGLQSPANYGTGVVTVDGSAGAAKWEITGNLFLGYQGNNASSQLSNGTLNIINGGIVTVGGSLPVGDLNNAKGTLNIQSGGQLTSGDSAIGNFNAGAQGEATVTGAGSKWTLTGTNALVVGGVGTGKLTIADGGTVTAPKGTIVGNAGSGELHVNGGANGSGTLETLSLVGGTGTKSVTFNGGTLKATGASTNFISGFTGSQFEIASGGMVVDTAGFDVATAAGNVVSGAGTLTKVGAGTLTLFGANTFSGGLTVNGGTAAAGAAGAFSSGLLTVADGAT
ncbi:autotransporter-associated beta strand repeat-containing protein, partial [Mesorhizobium sp. RMAD-H1]|uniref:beta strand repeat-containing protein n=1 Tax=Mesorhizobium sp. RMAD-H1 TaxID=2587065 RepID=UPI0016073B9B